MNKRPYTEAEKRGFRLAFAQKKRRRDTMMILAIAVGLVLLPTVETVIESRGSLLSVLLLIGLVALVVGGSFFEARDWHCPACGQSLGNERNPKACRKCGIPLQ